MAFQSRLGKHFEASFFSISPLVDFAFYAIAKVILNLLTDKATLFLTESTIFSQRKGLLYLK